MRDWRQSGFVKDLRSWPKENQQLRLRFAIAGIVFFILGTVFAAGLGVPADMPGGTLTAGGVLLFLLFFLPVSAGPLIVYVRYIRSLAASVLTGLALTGIIVYAFAFMVTSTSSTAGLAILGPAIYNWAVVAGGIILDKLLRWTARR